MAFETLRQVFGNRISQDRASMLREQEADSALGRLRKTLDIQHESEQGQEASALNRANLEQLQQSIEIKKRDEEAEARAEEWMANNIKWTIADLEHLDWLSESDKERVKAIRESDYSAEEKAQLLNAVAFENRLRSAKPEDIAPLMSHSQWGPAIKELKFGTGVSKDAQILKRQKAIEKYRADLRKQVSKYESDLQNSLEEKRLGREQMLLGQKGLQRMELALFKSLWDEQTRLNEGEELSADEARAIAKTFDYDINKLYREGERAIEMDLIFFPRPEAQTQFLTKLNEFRDNKDIVGMAKHIFAAPKTDRWEEIVAMAERVRKGAASVNDLVEAGKNGGSNPPPPPEAGNLDNPEKLSGSAIDTQNDIWIGSPPGASGNWVYGRTADKRWVRLKDANGNPLDKSTLDKFIESNEGKDWTGKNPDGSSFTMKLTRDLIMKILKRQAGVQ